MKMWKKKKTRKSASKPPEDYCQTKLQSFPGPGTHVRIAVDKGDPQLNRTRLEMCPQTLQVDTAAVFRPDQDCW